MTSDSAHDTELESWGRYPRGSQKIFTPLWRTQRLLPEMKELPWLAYGQGRSYGDLCLNHGGTSIQTSALDNLISFDRETGRVRCEAGLTLEHLLEVVIPQGWFIPVSPGTRYVTVGGAIANDIHGKNHHSAGTFGRHLLSLTLLRSDGSVLSCSPHENQGHFSATIGGMGLTGLIVETELQLRKIESSWIQCEELQFHGLDEFLSISKESDKKFEYTVAWIDSLSSGRNFMRGVFIRGNHASRSELSPAQGDRPLKGLPSPKLAVPCDFPAIALNKLTVSAFNALYFHKQLQPLRRKVVHCGPFFYPLDAVRGWNRIYGKRGFFQFQCVVPREGSREVLTTLLGAVVKSERASFLSVLKEFGDLSSPGMLSFPRPGITLCLDFPNEGGVTRDLLSKLEHVVMEAGGALYPAKDACMTRETFAKSFPRLSDFMPFKDPQFSSSFWRRIYLGAEEAAFHRRKL